MTGRGKGRGKVRKREAAISALLSAGTIAAAAAQVGLSERTLLRWLADATFAAAYHGAQAKLLESAINRLRTSATDFAETLHSICKNPKLPSGSRAMAASRGLELLLKAASLENLTQRVDELERNAATIGRRHE